MTRCGLLLLALALGAVASCRYQMISPGKLDEAVRVEISVNEGRLVRSQAYVQQDMAAIMIERLGWRVSPVGTAVLQVQLGEEEISTRSTDRQDIPNNWGITLNGQATLFTRDHAPITVDFKGTGYSRDRASEDNAIRLASANAASQVADVLENASSLWRDREDQE